MNMKAPQRKTEAQSSEELIWKSSDKIADIINDNNYGVLVIFNKALMNRLQSFHRGTFAQDTFLLSVWQVK